jgi:hypothetical protein
MIEIVVNLNCKQENVTGTVCDIFKNMPILSQNYRGAPAPASPKDTALAREQ